VLETEWETHEGAVRVVDCMPPRGVAPALVRVVEGLRGKVTLSSELCIRFDYLALVNCAIELSKREGNRAARE
jgi:hypothetical protein